MQGAQRTTLWMKRSGERRLCFRKSHLLLLSGQADLWASSSWLKAGNTFISRRHRPMRCAASCSPEECFRAHSVVSFWNSHFLSRSQAHCRMKGVSQAAGLGYRLGGGSQTLPGFLSRSQRPLAFVSWPCLWVRTYDSSHAQIQSTRKPQGILCRSMTKPCREKGKWMPFFFFF